MFWSPLSLIKCVFSNDVYYIAIFYKLILLDQFCTMVNKQVYYNLVISPFHSFDSINWTSSIFIKFSPKNPKQNVAIYSKYSWFRNCNDTHYSRNTRQAQIAGSICITGKLVFTKNNWFKTLSLKKWTTISNQVILI